MPSGTPTDPSLDPQLAPRPPHPGYFHASFLENPWFELENKLGIPHVEAVVPAQHHRLQHDCNTTQPPPEQAVKPAQQSVVAAEASPS